MISSSRSRWWLARRSACGQILANAAVQTLLVDTHESEFFCFFAVSHGVGESTGTQSPETKAKTRLNAMRDGFSGQVTTLSDEDRPIFEKFKSDFIKDLVPKNVMELLCVAAVCFYLLLRCHGCGLRFRS
jgi:hypothetical protein